MMMGLGKRVISDKGISSLIYGWDFIFNKNNRLTEDCVTEIVFSTSHFSGMMMGLGRKRGYWPAFIPQEAYIVEN